MNRIRRSLMQTLTGVVLTASCAFPQATISAHPGTVNYLEGAAYLNGQQIQQNQIGHINVDADQTLRTDDRGKAEVLLTPGVFLRIGPNSEIRMVSNSLTDIQVALNHGEALVDVAQMFKGNNFQILDNGVSVSLEKNGLYQFNADRPSVAVYDGKAVVNNNDSHIDVKKGHELLLANAGKLRTEDFDTKKNRDDLYTWSSLRSQYAAEASYASARTVYVNNGWGGGPWGNRFFGGSGWYWNSGFSSWAFVPGNSYFYDPFGWGFFSPGYLPYAPVYYAPGRFRPVIVNPNGVRGLAGGHYVGRGPLVGRGSAVGVRAVPRAGFVGGGGAHFRGGMSGGRR